jgi:hypothetical protein
VIFRLIKEKEIMEKPSYCPDTLWKSEEILNNPEHCLCSCANSVFEGKVNCRVCNSCIELAGEEWLELNRTGATLDVDLELKININNAIITNIKNMEELNHKIIEGITAGKYSSNILYGNNCDLKVHINRIDGRPYYEEYYGKKNS